MVGASSRAASSAFMCRSASVTVPTILDLLSVRCCDPTIVQEIPHSSISLTISTAMGWVYLNDIHVMVHFTRSDLHASCESPWHSLAKHRLLGACFPRMAPFRSMLLTLRGGPES